MVVSDHSPCPPILKRRDVGDFFVAWGGIASLQLGSAVVWTAMRERGLEIERLVNWMSAAPARLAGLEGRKGRIAPGYDADLVLFDPDEELTVRADMLLHRHALTPYLGERLNGTVRATYVRGELAYDRRTGPATTPPGQLLLPAHSWPTEPHHSRT
jgi:allantoinase